jgi:hypothetical protein
MNDQDGPQRKAASHKSLDSVGSFISTSSTLRGEEGKNAWTDSPKKISFDDHDDREPLLAPDTRPAVPTPLIIEPGKPKTATWKELPNKGQLALLTASRLAEPLTQTSLQSYMFYQLKSFDPSQTDDVISSQAGLLGASFTAAQFMTAILWGRAADSELFGRKRVIMVGLLGTMVSAVGFGFSRSFRTAIFFRIVGGALNGNVGVMRTVSPECQIVSLKN